MRRRAAIGLICTMYWTTALLADNHTLRVQFSTTFDDECDVSYPGGTVVARPAQGKPAGSGGNFDRSVTVSAQGTINAVLKNLNGKSVEVGPFCCTIQAVCKVFLDGTQLGALSQNAYVVRGAIWTQSWAIPGSQPSGGTQTGNNVQPVPTSLTISPQQQIALAQQFLGSDQALTNIAPLTSAAPFTMPIGNNIVAEGASRMTVQAVESAAMSKLQIIIAAYAKAFGRMPTSGQSGELAYWAARAPFTLDGLLNANSAWLRTNQQERTGTIQRAFAAALRRLGMGNRALSASEFNTWNGRVAQSGTLYADVNGRPGLVTQMAASLVPPIKGQVGGR